MGSFLLIIMKNRNHFLCYYIALLPIIISVFFIGYLKPRFDVLLHVDSTVGEGFMSAYTAGNPNITAYYSGSIPYTKENQTVAILNCLYDMQGLTLEFSGIDETEIQDADVRVFGITLGHFTGIDLMSQGIISKGIGVETNNTAVRFTFEDSSISNTVTFQGANFLPWFFWILYLGLIGVITLFVSLLYKSFHDKYLDQNTWIIDISFTLATLLIGSAINSSLAYITYNYFFLNFIILFCVALFIGVISFRPLGMLIANAICFVFYIANYFVILYRIRPIMPSDLEAIGTARQVLSGYSLTPPISMVILALIWLAACFLYCSYYRILHKRRTENLSLKNKIYRRIGNAICSLLVLFISVHNPVYDSLGTFKWDYRLLAEFHNQGMLLTFVQNFLSSRVKEPEGYSSDKVDDVLESLQKDSISVDSGQIQPSRIVMVMDEAFSDLRSAGLDGKVDVMPFIDSLGENTVSGDLYVSVLGGGTCNTEFEALTGNSMAFLPYGTYPYNEYINNSMFSLAQFFKDTGYATNAFHPQEAHNWNRSTVYPLLGFDKFYAIDDFLNISTIDGKASDMSDFKFVEQKIKTYGEEKNFEFNVTLQNHAGYNSWDGVTESESTKNLPYEDLRIYLSLIKETDNAVSQLINSYKESDVPTMIIFFGDHQPALSSSSANYVYGNNADPLNVYKTKFFIWTNYPSHSENDVKISANFLPWLIMKLGNFNMPSYIKMLGEIHDKYPVITAQGVIDADGNQYSSVEDVLDDPLIREYQYVQYANMFDKISEAWFQLN